MSKRNVIGAAIAAVSLTFSLGAMAQAMRVDANGNVGIGTLNPSEAVDVERSNAASRFQLTSFSSTPVNAAQFIQRRAQGTADTPSAVLNKDNLGLISFRGYTGSGFSGTKAGITAQAQEDWTPTANGTRLVFQVTPVGTTTLQNVMEISQDGQVKVNGTALNVPDYVFEPNYPLMSLDDLQAYVKAHKHLPGVAAADDVKSEGLDLAGSQMDLLKKVEELTLYTLQQHETLKQIDELKAENARLKAQYATLQKKVEKVDQLEQVVNLLMQREQHDQLMTAQNQ